MKYKLTLTFFIITSSLFSQDLNTRKWRKSEKDSLDNALLLYEEKNYLLAYPTFENLLNQHPKEGYLKYACGICALSRSDKHHKAYEYLSELYAKNKKIENIKYDLARAAHYTNHLDEAETLIKEYLAPSKMNLEDKKNGLLLQRYISNAKYHLSKPTNAKIVNMGTPLNSSDEEYVPAINASEDVMVFTYKGVKSKGGKMNSFLTPDPQGAYTEDLYISKKEKGKFSAPEPLEEINTTAHDACVSISLDGQLLYFYRNTADDHGDLYQAQVSGQGFSKPKKLKGYVNSYAYEGHCSLSPDGNTLYFTSDRSGGYGGVDIYRATMLPDSSWGNIVNLGDSINTPYDEDAPFIHPDGVSLFYSSKGRNSMGGYDIFKATMNVKDSSFKKVQHLGYPINSTDDDIYFVVAANGERAYYSSAKQDGQGLKDIYMIDTKFEGLKPALMLVKGTTKRKGMAVGSNNQIKIISQSGKVYKNFTSNNTSGQFMVSVPAGEKYKFVFKDELGNFKEFDFDLTSLNAYKEENLDVNFDAMTVANSTPTVAASNTDAAVNTNTIKPSTVGSTTFVPNNIAQATSLSYAKENGNVDVGAQGIQFRVQIAALKYPKAMNFPYLKNCGKIETLLLVDGITRVTIGGKFTTLNDALKHNKKVIDAGQKDAFITAIYQNKRMLLEELVNMGIFKPQKVD
jgi:hypothetical protein